MAQHSCPLNNAIKRATDCNQHFIILLANLMMFAELKNIRQDNNKDWSSSKLSRMCYVILVYTKGPFTQAIFVAATRSNFCRAQVATSKSLV